MRLTRLRADSRGTPTARGRQCRMSKKGQKENKNTQNTQIDLNKSKLKWTLSLPQTSRTNPVQCCSTHQKKKKAYAHFVQGWFTLFGMAHLLKQGSFEKDTYKHFFLKGPVCPIFLWLIWQNRNPLKNTPMNSFCRAHMTLLWGLNCPLFCGAHFPCFGADHFVHL